MHKFLLARQATGNPCSQALCLFKG